MEKTLAVVTVCLAGGPFAGGHVRSK